MRRQPWHLVATLGLIYPLGGSTSTGLCLASFYLTKDYTQRFTTTQRLSYSMNGFKRNGVLLLGWFTRALVRF